MSSESIPEYNIVLASNSSIRKKILDFDMDGAKEKFDNLKDLKNLSDKFNDLKKNLSNNDKPQDQYSAEDLRKLNDILKSVDKD